MKQGLTFSHRYLEELKIPVLPAFQDVLSLGVEYVRLCVYWDEIETNPEEYDFAQMHKLLTMAKERGQKVILTVGMKAPRWPEFHIPEFYRFAAIKRNPQVLFNFLERVLLEFGEYTNIFAYQVENEPLDPSGPQFLDIPLSLLKLEVEQVRRFNKQKKPILLTLWGNKLVERGNLAPLLELADIIGLDLYYKVPNGKSSFAGPDLADEKIKALIANSPKPVWITELQTCPWKGNPHKLTTELFVENQKRVQILGAEAVLWWGAERWLERKEHGNPQLWNLAKKFVTSS